MKDIALLEKSLPVAPIRIAALEGCRDLAEEVDKKLVKYRKELITKRELGIVPQGYSEKSFLVDCECSRFGTGEGQNVLAEIAVVDRDPRKVCAGIAEMFLAYAYVYVAEHVAVPERAPAVCAAENALVVLVGNKQSAHFVAEGSLYGLIKRLGLTVDIDVPVLAAAVLAEVCNALEFVVKARINFLHKVTSLRQSYHILSGLAIRPAFVEKSDKTA